MEIVCGNYHFDVCKKRISLKELQDICHGLGLAPNEFYLISNGRKISDNVFGKVHIVPRTLGGKGGFGSMLRAIGAQIEKTTNREACRDLSGRRLRDINEEQRLKKWVEQQAEREKEAKERKKKKLEKLLEQPRHEFKDEQYDKERSTLPEKVEDAVLKGLEASCSSMKRKTNDTNSKIAKKKPKLWLDSELDEDISSSGSDSEEKSHTKEPTSSTQLKSEDSSTTEATKTHIVHKADEEKSSSNTRTSSLDDTTHMNTDILERKQSILSRKLNIK